MKSSLVCSVDTHGAWLTNTTSKDWETMTCIYNNNHHGQVIGLFNNTKDISKAHDKAVALTPDNKATLQVITDKNKLKMITIPVEDVEKALHEMLDSLVGKHYEELQKAKEVIL